MVQPRKTAAKATVKKATAKKATAKRAPNSAATTGIGAAQAVKKAVADNAAKYHKPSQANVTLKRISIKELPEVLQAIVAESVGNDETRVSIVSHTEIIIYNPKD